MRGFIAGAFDLLHPGHIYTLRECKMRCDKLVVGLHVNPSLERPSKNKPVETVFERFIRLAACKYVDEIVPYETEEDLLNILHTLNLDIRFLDVEYSQLPERITGKDIVPIVFIEREHSWSSRRLRKRI